eukprot:7877985-Ditylum_brightwellii.AAC.1
MEKMYDEDGHKLDFKPLETEDESIIHTKWDLTYTLIGIPWQGDDPHLKFCSVFKNNKRLWINMIKGYAVTKLSRVKTLIYLPIPQQEYVNILEIPGPVK